MADKIQFRRDTAARWASVNTILLSGEIGLVTDSENKYKLGDGSSAAYDDAILADYLADTNWATYSSRLDTWYNYLHPTT